MTEDTRGGMFGLPYELVERAREDTEFAARLLHVDTRREALGEVGLESDYELDARLDEIANMSLREAMTKLGGEQRLQP